ncbi:MAG: uracil-DNA glycosylase, partial [Armatimonadetes bacterium]|nr:uracil-DNA glycosylase [Armatimonadota bacterium]
MKISELQDQQANCFRCPRLVAWREAVAQDPPARFRGDVYWARPVPSLGDESAQLLIVGLAPAAHGGNRTGRIFTGDRSGDWLFRALFRAGFCSQETSKFAGDGLELINCYISAAAHCAPPDNKPLPEELGNCRPFLLEELQQLRELRVVVGLGKIGFDAAFDALREVGLTKWKTRPKFGHGAKFEIADKLFLLGTYHPSQQNT